MRNEKLEMRNEVRGEKKKVRKTSHELLRTFNVIFPNFS